METSHILIVNSTIHQVTRNDAQKGPWKRPTKCAIFQGIPVTRNDAQKGAWKLVLHGGHIVERAEGQAFGG
ncbi:MAG: hypothetical protein ACRD88_04240 [Terriglobia bacterium]